MLSTESQVPADPAVEATLRDSILATPPTAVPGVAVPGYDLLGELGRGGMGVVYRARHRTLNRTVALKVVLSAHARPEDRERFRQEAEAIARLNHPGVVQVYEVGEHAGAAFLAMELVEGGSLFQWQRGRPAPPRVAAEVVRALAKAVHHAHDKGIIHRDIKPGNVLLKPGRPESVVATPGGPPAEPNPFPFVPKLTDFGLAKPIDGAPDLTVPGVTCGTPSYMSPEQVRNLKGTVGPRSDVYGLGAVLYELLTGNAPFPGTSSLDIFPAVLKEPPVRPRSCRADVPPDLETVCLKCLEKNPDRRYATAQALADDLSRFLTGRPIQARAVGRAERAWRWARRNPSPTAALAVLAVGLCAVSGLSLALWRASRAEAREAEHLADALVALRAERDALAAANAQKAAEQKRAEDNLKIARDATRVTLTELSREPLLQEPRFLDVRKRLLDRAKPTFDQFIAQATDDPAVLAEQADVCRLLGGLRATVGDTAIADEGYAQSHDFYRRLTALKPSDAGPVVAAADVRLQHAFLLRETGRAAEGDRVVEETIAGLLAAAPRFPNNAEVAVATIRARLSYVHRLSSPGRVRASAAPTRVAAGQLNELTRRTGETDRTVYLRGRVHQQAARAAAANGSADEAECHFTEGLAVFEGLIVGGPKDLGRRGELAGLQLDYAEFLTATGRPADARGQLLSAVARLDALLTESPRAVRFLMLWARATVALGAAEEALGRPAEARACYDRAAAQWLPVCERYPEWVLGRQAARELLTRRAALHELDHNPDAAADDRARLARIPPG